jgi:hypothetical protein
MDLLLHIVGLLQLSKRAVVFVGLPILSLLIACYIPYGMVVSRSYAFIPYALQIEPGTNGDGSLSYPPAIVPNSAVSSFLTWPMNLGAPSDLGWSGDRIVQWDRTTWTAAGLVEGTNVPAILAANYGQGHIVYVTNQLAPHEKLVYNILAWYSRQTGKPIRVGVMIDSTDPPEQILNDWERCFSHVVQFDSTSHVVLNIQEERIRQYDLNTDSLSKFDVLILAVGWGDGYYATGWNWNSHHREIAIQNFVKDGGLLLLPEAGFFDDYGVQIPGGSVIPPTRTLEQLLSTQTSAFGMVGLSLSAIGVLYTINREGRYLRLARRYDYVAGYLLFATFLWFVVPMLQGDLPRQTASILWALSMYALVLGVIAAPIGLLGKRKVVAPSR